MTAATHIVAPRTTAGATLVPTGGYEATSSPLHIDFAIRLVTDDMAPAYRKGDTVFLRHVAPGAKNNLGDDYLMAKGPRSEFLAPTALTVCLVELQGKTRTHWRAAKLNPRRVRRLSRALWQPAYVVVGLYRTSKASIAARVYGST